MPKATGQRWKINAGWWIEGQWKLGEIQVDQVKACCKDIFIYMYACAHMPMVTSPNIVHFLPSINASCSQATKTMA